MIKLKDLLIEKTVRLSTMKDANFVPGEFVQIVGKKGMVKLDKKDVKFFDIVDEQVWDNLSNIFTLFNSRAYEDMRNFSEDYEVSINGTDVIKKDKSKKIA